jgi:hypothetical protein
MTKTPATKLFSLNLCRWCAALVAFNAFAVPITPLPDTVAGAAADQQDMQIPDRVQLRGWLGTRMAASLTNRLQALDTALLLEGYRHRPGHQDWEGEHVGKWLHAATLAWAYSGDPVLRAKLDDTVAALCKCQLEDGYLGTYLDKDRWTSWDVWSHKYNLIGFITYMRYTGNLTPLPTCRRMAGLLCQTFGDGPGQRDIIASGTHVGMAPTSVLEPMALLYRFTGEPKYLEFCKYLLRSWEQPNGPHIVSRLLQLKRVDKVGNAKAYEMLSCLNGALELYRTTGDRELLDACRNAWQDIVDHRLYITGGASSAEHFRADDVLPNDMASRICETCVTVTWMQVNLQLLRLTGDAKFADQLETSVYNHLLAAQNPRGDDWCYYTPLEGRKPYDNFITCCHSSGPRGIALLPTFAITTDSDGAVINLYDAGTAHLTLRDGTPITLKLETLYPADGRIHITVETKAPKAFSIKLRVPAWCRDYSIRPSDAKSGNDGYTSLQRTWKSGDTIELNLKLAPRVVAGNNSNQDKAAVLCGPLVLAADAGLLETDAHQALNNFALPQAVPVALDIIPEPARGGWKTWAAAQLFRINGVNRLDGSKFTTRLVPFSDAGIMGGRFKIWLPLAGRPVANLLLDGRESRSRQGEPAGSVNDDDFQSVASTRDGKLSTEDWFAVSLNHPASVKRVVFTLGNNNHDGGWFDTSAGKPRVQIRPAAGSSWETIGVLADYPATTAAKSNFEWDQTQFTLNLADSVELVAIRVIGAPSCGDNPRQNYATCAELQAFSK